MDVSINGNSLECHISDWTFDGQPANTINWKKELLRKFNVADGIKEPDAEQLQTIQDLNASVVNVAVTAGAAELPRKIAARTKELKKDVDDRLAAYDKECKVS